MRFSFRRATTAALVLGLAVVGLSGCAAEPSTPSEDTVTIGLTYTPNIQFAPFYLAEQKGYFEEQGVHVELRHHGESEELFGALANGTEDFVFAGGDEIVQARSAGTDVVSIATLYSSYPAALIVPKDSSIQSGEDLKGHKVGVPGPYGQTYAALLALLSEAKLGEHDLSLEHIGYTQQAALTSGKVDAVMGYANNDAVQLERAGFPVRVIPAFTGDDESLVGPALAASSTSLAAHSASASKVLIALAKATGELIANPEDAMTAAEEFIPTLTSSEQRDAARATLDATIPFLEAKSGDVRFANDEETWQRMVEFMAEHKLLSGETPRAEDTFTNEYLPVQ